ncbi:hypothetical protein PAMP_014628 [Pampus punctatissimus]
MEDACRQLQVVLFLTVSTAVPEAAYFPAFRTLENKNVHVYARRHTHRTSELCTKWFSHHTTLEELELLLLKPLLKCHYIGTISKSVLFAVSMGATLMRLSTVGITRGRIVTAKNTL